MTERTQIPPTKARTGWKICLLVVSSIAVLIGVLGVLYVFRADPRPAVWRELGMGYGYARMSNQLGAFGASAGSLVVGILGVLGFGIWITNRQWPAISGGLISGALLCLLLLIEKVGAPFMLLLMLVLPLGGFVAANSHFRKSLNKVSLGRAAAIGLRAGGVAATVALVFAVPIALFVAAQVNAEFAPMRDQFAPDVQLPRSAAGTIVGWLVLSLIAAALSALGGLIGGGVAKKPGKVLAAQQQSHTVFIHVNGQQHGPYTLDLVTEWHKSGTLQPNDMIFSQGQWIPVASFFAGDKPANGSPHSNLDELK